jgi:glucosamine--fructose-6-phosphate aminotransferase (isomerizing)
VLNRQDEIVKCADRLADANNVFFIGRGISLPVAMEGALKLKEISYIHAEAYAAGELKHGPLALIEKQTPVIAVTAPDNTYTATLTSIEEVKTRGAPVIAIASESCPDISEYADCTIFVPGTHRLLSPVLNTIALQLLAYHTACKRNCPVDFPRNLAKSVTVE